jgi:hypothetical protein
VIVIFIDKLLHVSAQILQIAVLPAVNLFLFQGSDKSLTSGVSRIGWWLMLGIMPCACSVSTYSWDAYCTLRSE